MPARRLSVLTVLTLVGSVVAGGPLSAGAEGRFSKSPKPVDPSARGIGAFPAGTIRATGGPGRTSPSGGIVVGPNVNVSQLRGNQAETTVGINPTNPNNIVVLSNMETGTGLFKAFSMNGGLTWSRDKIADGDNLGSACCDPSGAFDEFGNFHLTFLNASVNRVDAAISIDGGATFQFLGTVRSGGVDQPTVTTGPGAVWWTWKLFGPDRIEARGAEVTGLGDVGSFSPVQFAPGSGPGNFGDIGVGNDGRVLVVYQDNIPTEGPSNIFVHVDPDGFGGSGFGAGIDLGRTNVGGFDYIPAQSGRSVDAETDFAFDRSSGPFRGRIYLAYTDERRPERNDLEILIRSSDDGGLTWTPRRRVNDDATRNSQFLPRMAVDSSTGFVAIGFHDARNDSGDGGPGDTNGVRNDDAQFWGAVSRNGGATWENVRISEGTSNDDQANNGVDYGDYIGLDYVNGSFYAAWSDNSNSTGDNPDVTLNDFDLYTAEVAVT
jgi:hypothetical protein